MTASTNRWTPVTVTVSKKSQTSRALAWEQRETGPGGGGAVGRRVDPGVVEYLPDRRGDDLDAEDEGFAVDAPVPPAREMLSSTFPGLCGAGDYVEPRCPLLVVVSLSRVVSRIADASST
jgi:hypothetical protein